MTSALATAVPGFNFLVPQVASDPGEADLSPSVMLTPDQLLWNVVIGHPNDPKDPVSDAVREYGVQLLKKSGYFTSDESWHTVRTYDYALTADPKRWPSEGRHILVAPAGDLFSEAVPEHFLDRVLYVMQQHPKHTFYIVTKNAARMRLLLEARAKRVLALESLRDPELRTLRWPLPNVWVGIRAHTQRTYMSRCVQLVQTPAQRRLVHIDGLASPLSLDQIPLETRDVLWPLKGLVQAYRGMDGEGRLHWESLDEPLQVVNGVDWVILNGRRGEAQQPLHPHWLAGPSRSCHRDSVPFYFRSWGSLVPVKKPDLEGDPTLVIVSKDGTMRGRGVGAPTNFLHADTAAGDFYMTRRAAPEAHEAIGSTRVQQRPSDLPKPRVRLLDHSEAARKLKRMADTQAAMAALPSMPPAEDETRGVAKPETLVSRAMRSLSSWGDKLQAREPE